MPTRRQVLTSTIAATLATQFARARSAWRSAAALPLQTQELYPAVHKGKLYVAGGIAARLGVPYFTNRCIAYDPVKDTWEDVAELPKDLHHAALVSTGDRLFCCGGFNGGYTHVWRMTQTMWELVDTRWEEIGDLPQPQAEGVIATSTDGEVHLVTGQSPRGAANSERSDHTETTAHWAWHPQKNSWRECAPIPTARNSATGGWVSGRLVVAGGRTSKGNLANTEIYNPQTDTWEAAASMPLPQAGTAGVTTAHHLYVFGGEIFQPTADVFANTWRYDLAANTWEALPDLPTPRHGLGAGLIGQRIYVVGGATEPGGRGTSAANEYFELSP